MKKKNYGPKKPKRPLGRPRKLKSGFIAINVKLTPESWAALHARAEIETSRHAGDKVTLSDVARTAIDEWLLACAVGQRPPLRSAQSGGGT
ncbi:MAG: hypothetical protein IT381_21230 [Deltaproteobacteria bacterium]|nr:hypothetical protein [Deltaproteobacteria bacterium]